jgi:HAD superfamily hydrolase (TIGR01459 family)
VPVAILDHCGPLLARYDLLICDIWGVLHDGVTAYPEACEALTRFREGGGTVVLLSNAPMPGASTARLIAKKGVPDQAYDRIVTSGDLTLHWVRRHGMARVFHIGPPKRDDALFRSGLERVPFAEAEAVVCSGLVDDETETAADYAGQLGAMLERGLTLVCANPDLAVEVGGRIYPCAGAVGALYEEMGGEVIWAGKPHALAYDTALAAGREARQGEVAAERVLCIGDALRTDIAGAAQAGLDALFIAGGLHRHDIWTDGALDPARATTLVQASGLPCKGIAARLAW